MLKRKLAVGLLSAAILIAFTNVGIAYAETIKENTATGEKTAKIEAGDRVDQIEYLKAHMQFHIAPLATLPSNLTFPFQVPLEPDREVSTPGTTTATTP